MHTDVKGTINNEGLQNQHGQRLEEKLRVSGLRIHSFQLRPIYSEKLQEQNVEEVINSLRAASPTNKSKDHEKGLD